MKVAREWVMMAALAVGLTTLPMMAQGAGAAAGRLQHQRQAGTVKSTSATGLTLTTAAGQDVTVTVPDAAKVLVVAPGSRDLKSATRGNAERCGAGG